MHQKNTRAREPKNPKSVAPDQVQSGGGLEKPIPATTAVSAGRYGVCGGCLSNARK
jgi:hypothetical protein